MPASTTTANDLTNNGNTAAKPARSISRRQRHQLLRSRQRLLQILAHLLQRTEPSQEPVIAATSAILLNRFCDHLVDYLSQGHFRTFGRQAAVSLPALLTGTTTDLVNFADRHGNVAEHCSHSIRAELNQVALTLEARFEVEDLLLQLPQHPTRRTVAQASGERRFNDADFAYAG